MTRRLVIALVGTALAAVVVVGAGTIVLVRVNARDAAADAAADEAAAIAGSFRPGAPGGIRPSIDDGEFVVGIFGGVGRAIGAEALSLVTVDRDDGTLTVEVVGRLADESRADAIGDVALGSEDLATLSAGGTVTGDLDGSVYALAPVPSRPSGDDLVGVVVVRGIEGGLGRAGGWFVLSALATVALAVVVALRLGRRLTQRVREASALTVRIADGDLTGRLPEESGPRHDEIDELARSINAMAEGLQRSRGLEQQFLLSVSHDLRTPLTSIRGWAEAIGDGTVAEPSAAAGVITEEARRLEGLVADLLDLARLDASTFRLDIGDVDCRAVAASAADGARPALDAHGLGLVLDVPEHPLVGRVDADRLRQVLANLLENAMQHAATTVAVSADRRGGRIVLAVEDDGPGILAEDLPHVFERLYVSRHRPVRAETGSGLGLAIVRQLTEAMGGTVDAGRAPQLGGARLEVVVPAA